LVLDRIRPATVLDVVAEAVDSTTARVRWTVTRDDSLAGGATQVQMRRAIVPLTEFNFDVPSIAINVTLGFPKPSGVADTVLVEGLPQGSRWWFAVRVLDEVRNASAVSPSDSASLPGQPPERITDLRAYMVEETGIRLTWTAVGEGGSGARPLGYLVSLSESPFDSSTVDAAPGQYSRQAHVDAGAPESTFVGSLEPGHRYHLAVRAVDHSGRLGPISNVFAVVTPLGGALQGKGVLAVAPRPNPAESEVTLDWFGETSHTGPNHLLIHDANGRLVRRVALGSEPAGSYQWDGRDGDSRLVPAGLYFLRLVSGARHADARVVLLR
jgi:hypothetical protein